VGDLPLHRAFSNPDSCRSFLRVAGSFQVAILGKTNPGGLSEGKWVPLPEAFLRPLAHTGIALDPSTELAISLKKLAHRA
jgi:hypothetical protein